MSDIDCMPIHYATENKNHTAIGCGKFWRGKLLRVKNIAESSDRSPAVSLYKYWQGIYFYESCTIHQNFPSINIFSHIQYTSNILKEKLLLIPVV